jgi:hypothetical protein
MEKRKCDFEVVANGKCQQSNCYISLLDFGGNQKLKNARFNMQHLASHGTFEQSAGPHRYWLAVHGLTITIVRLIAAIKLGILLSKTVKVI